MSACLLLGKSGPEVSVELQDGFIVGIFNYCDGWCQACAFTSRCRLFADRAELEAGCDAHFKPVVDAPLLPEEEPPPTPAWMRELIDEMNEAAAQPMSKEEVERLRPTIRPEHNSIEARARAYTFRVLAWLKARSYAGVDGTSDPRAIVSWFCGFIGAKIHRALTSLAEGWEHDGPPDHDGSAKAALLAIERSHAAWLDMVERGLAPMADVACFIADLIWLEDTLEQVFPAARAFVRPAFDEPDAIAN